MRIGVPSETKVGEGRVALTPAAVRELVRAGAEVIVEKGAGRGSRFNDAAFAAQGAALVPDADAVWDKAELIIKVKEPQPVRRSRVYEPTMSFSLTCTSLPTGNSRAASRRPAQLPSPSRR
jgi:alanine dehydrogenase